MATAPDSVFPLSETYIAEALATELEMGLRLWSIFKDKCARITDEPIGHNCVICQTLLDPYDANAFLMATNTAENRRIITAKICRYSYHVGYLEGYIDHDPLCPICRSELLIRPQNTCTAPFNWLLKLRNGHFKGHFIFLEDDRVRVNSMELTGSIAMAAFALWTLKDENQVIATLVFDGEECPVLEKTREFELAGTEEGHLVVEAMIRIAFKHDTKRRCVENFRDALDGAPWEAQGAGAVIPEDVRKFAEVVARMAANDYAVSRGLR